MNLSQSVLRGIEKLETPFLVLDLKKVKENYKSIQKNFDFADVYFAIKANYDAEILKSLDSINANFEVGSSGELNKLRLLKVAPSRIIVSNTLKESKFIREAFEYGIDVFAADSMHELDKLKQHAPNSKVFIRLEVSNKGSDWPLTGKFGVMSDKALELMEHAKEMNLNPYGLIFHVGSQCLNPKNWVRALEICKQVEVSLSKAGIALKAINLGGGIPVRNTKEIPDIANIAKITKDYAKQNFGSVKFLMEPGRAIVGDAGFLVTTVIAKAMRHEKNWLSLDLGVFNGLADALGGFEWEYQSASGRSIKEFVLAGPTCDSADRIAKGVFLNDLEIGERLFVLNSAAYTTVYASDFDGFRIPKIYYLENFK